MPVTVGHALSATTPDDPAYEIKPSNWNAAHVVTFTPDGTEVIKWLSAGANSVSSGTVQFGNGGGITFGMDVNGVVTAAAPAGAPSPVNFSAGTRSADLGSIVFSDANGISFGLGGVGSSVMTGSHNAITTARASNDAIGLNSALTANGVSVTANSSGLSLNFPAFLTTAALSGDTTKYAGLGFTSTTTAGTDVKGTHSTNGLSMAFPAWLTTAQAPGAYLTTARASNDAIGLNSGLTANGVSVTANSSGLSLNFPAFLTTAALSGDTTKYAGLGFTSTTTAGTDVKGTHSTNGLSMAFPAWLTTVAAQTNQTGNFYVSGNTTQLSSTAGLDLRSLSFEGAGIASVGVSNGRVLVSVPSGGGAGDGYNIVSMLTSTSGGGTAGATFSQLSGSIGFMAGSNITLSQTSNTININAPNSSSIVGSSGISISTNGSTISVYEAPQSSYVLPDACISALGAMGNGSFSIRYQDVFDAVTATRVDMPFLWQQATTASANTVAIAMTVLCGIYTRNASTLNSVSSATTQTTYTYASNSAGATGITGSAVRPISIPMNVNMTPGAYYFGFGIRTTYSSIGTATTTAAQTISAMGVPAYSSAVGWVGDFSQASATSIGMLSGVGVYSATVNSVVPAISLSAINQSGSYFHRAQIALVFRN